MYKSCKKSIVGIVSLYILSFGQGAMASGQLNISPLRIDFDQSKKSASITIQNPSNEGVQIQVRSKKWTQTNGQDILLDSSDLAVAPKSFRIAPNDRQIVRIGLAKPIENAEELTYRLLIDEIPTQSKLENKVQMALNISLPVLVNSKPDLPDTIEWHHESISVAGKPFVRLTAKNNGSQLARVIQIEDKQKKLQFKAESSAAGYILKGQYQTWVSPIDKVPDVLDLQIKTPKGDSKIQSKVMQK